MVKTIQITLLIGMMVFLAMFVPEARAIGNLDSEERLDDVTWVIETVDPRPHSNHGVSLALDQFDRPHISYHDDYVGDLIYATRTYNGWVLDTLDSVGYVGRQSSLVFDSAGNPHMAYLDYHYSKLKYARWNGNEWVISSLDTAWDLGYITTVSLALGTDGSAHMSYYSSGYTVKYLRWYKGATLLRGVDYVGPRGVWGSSSIVLDTMQNPHVCYFDSYDSDIKCAHWNGAIWQIETVDRSGEQPAVVSFAMNKDDTMHLVYSSDGGLRYARRNGANWDIQTIDNHTTAGEPSLKLDNQGNPHVAYSADTLLYYASLTGGTWSIQSIEKGLCTSLALDSLNHPHISYYSDGALLKYASIASDRIHSGYLPLLLL